MRLLSIVLFGPFGRAVGISFVLCVIWSFWYFAPQGPVAVIRDRLANEITRDFGPTVDFGESLSSGSNDNRLEIETSDPTWYVVRHLDDHLSIHERGTGRLMSQLPPAKYEFIECSRWGRRLKAFVGLYCGIWDAENGTLIHQRKWDGNCMMSEDGRHLTIDKSAGDFGTDLEIVNVNRGEIIIRIQKGMPIDAISEDAVPPILSRHSWVSFCSNGRWMALYVRDADSKRWYWFWNLESKAPSWRVPISCIDDNYDPAFDPTGRYFGMSNRNQGLLVDLSTSPPTDLSDLIAGFSSNVKLAKGRVLGTGEGARTSEFRVWDLDQRRLVSSVPYGGGFSQNTAISPDHKIAILRDDFHSDRIENTIARFMSFWKNQSTTTRSQFLVIDLSTGKVINRIRSEHLLEFDKDLNHVWSRRNRVEDDDVIYECFPLRAPGPSIWLWLMTALGIVLVILDVRRSWRRKMTIRRSQLASI